MGHKPPTWLSYGGIGAGVVTLLVFAFSKPETAQSIYLTFLRWVFSVDSYSVVVVIWLLLFLPLPIHLTVVYIHGQRKDFKLKTLYRQQTKNKDNHEQPDNEIKTETGVVLRLFNNENNERVS